MDQEILMMLKLTMIYEIYIKTSISQESNSKSSPIALILFT
jgi:hypothetical protein